MCPFGRKSWRREITACEDCGRIVRGEGRVDSRGEFLKLLLERREGIVGQFRANQDTAAEIAARGATNCFHAGNRSAGSEAADVNKFVGGNGCEDAAQAAPAGTLLHNERDGERALNFGRVGVRKNFEQCCGAEAIADGSASEISSGEVRHTPLNGDGVEDVHASFPDFRGRRRADVDVHCVNIRRAGRTGALWIGRLQMDRKACENSVDAAAGASADSNGLRGIKFVENWRETELREALHAEKTVGGDFADDKTGLVDGGDDQAAGRTRADRYDDVAEIVFCGVKRRELVQNFVAEGIFVARDGGRCDEIGENGLSAGVYGRGCGRGLLRAGPRRRKKECGAEGEC